jgi:hypothetical protein
MEAMKRDRIIKFRGSDRDAERVNELRRQTGLNTSELLRELLHSAELRPNQTLRPVAHLNSNTSGNVLPDPAGIAR